MASEDLGKITGLLKAWRRGDQAAQEELIPLVYNELRDLASRYRRNAGAGDTFQTTALVNEAYLKLVDIKSVDWRDRVHFFAVSANVMRRILIDIARASTAEKRGGRAPAVFVPDDWNEIAAPDSKHAEELLVLDDALTRLVDMDARRGKIVELRVFGGLSVEETAQALEVSPATVMRDWRIAKAWLLRECSSRRRGARRS